MNYFSAIWWLQQVTFICPSQRLKHLSVFNINSICQVTRPRRVPLVEQKLTTLPEHLSSLPVLSEVRVTRSLVFSVMCCRFPSVPFLLTIVLFCPSIYVFWLSRGIFKLFLSVHFVKRNLKPGKHGILGLLYRYNSLSSGYRWGPCCSSFQLSVLCGFFFVCLRSVYMCILRLPYSFLCCVLSLISVFYTMLSILDWPFGFL